jgi:hypothetical protein
MPAALTTPSTAKTEPATSERPYWGDRVAMVFWTGCFILMSIIFVKDLIVSLFR